jgi:N-acyl-D-amino-acid deacylase
MSHRVGHYFFLFLIATTPSCSAQRAPFQYDIIIRNGTVYDGLGGEPQQVDVAINADTIAAIGDLSIDTGKKILDAKGQAVSPGFINMLSWAGEILTHDGRAMSDIKQGVTLEVFGEGESPAPRLYTPKDKRWKSFNEYFNYLEKRGCSPNFASFVGATTVRSYVLGFVNRAPDSLELNRMKELVRQAMNDGALGLGSSLIYAPSDFASTEELIELCKVVSEFNGMYITHMRSESDKILSAMNEAFRIGQEANVPVEIYHLKINHERNWNKIDTVIAKIDSAQKAGLKVTANMYTYNASSTGLNARIPTWVQEGGMAAMRKRLKNPVTRKKILADLSAGIPTKNSDPKDVLVLGFNRDSLNRLYKNKRLDEISRLHGKNADETMLDLMIADRSAWPIPSIYFLISEENVKRMLQLPFVSICSDAMTMADEAPGNTANTHPRVYGSFARLLGKYVREENLMSLQEAVRRMTSLPASNLKIKKRGVLAVGNYADVVIFDPETITDNATFENSHEYSTGVSHVLVNGVPVLENGQHTGKMPGRAVRGPGYKKPTKP